MMEQQIFKQSVGLDISKDTFAAHAVLFEN